MKTKDFLYVGGVAIATALVTLACAWPDPLIAGSEAKGVVAATPTLKHNGCRLWINPLKAGDDQWPALELTAENGSAQQAEFVVAIQATSMRPVSPVSRMMPRPREIGRCEVSVSLKPGQSRTYSVKWSELKPAAAPAITQTAAKPDLAAKAEGELSGSIITVLLQAGTDNLVAGSFTIGGSSDRSFTVRGSSGTISGKWKFDPKAAAAASAPAVTLRADKGNVVAGSSTTGGPSGTSEAKTQLAKK